MGCTGVARCHGPARVSGCRIAQAGEFTKNAFFAGKIDLTQAEAVAKIIKASSEAELKLLIVPRPPTVEEVSS